MLKYYYTKFGEVFAGWEFSEMQHKGYTIVIQGTKLRDYRELKHEEKTLEKISEYGWVLGNDSIVGVLNSDVFNPKSEHYHGDWWKGEFERKHLFIFGAGASANCIYSTDKKQFVKDDLRPPLGPDLFDARFKKYYSKYEGVKESLHFLQDETGSDVEALFEEEWKDIYKHNNQPVLSRHINIQYYLQELLRDISKNVNDNYVKNLYSAFCLKLQKKHSASISNNHGNVVSYKKFAFVSFNQDTILDSALSTYFKKPINNMWDYINYNDSPFCLFKPHGSWNWGWKFPSIEKFKGNTPKFLYDNNINFFQLYFELLGNHVDMIDWSTWGVEASINCHGLGKHTIDKSRLELVNDNLHEYFPGLLLPYRDKDEFTMPLPHFMAMHSYINLVETIVIIGWKGNEDAFNRLLYSQAHSVKKVIIVDPAPEIVAKNLKPLLEHKKIKPIYYSTFEDFVLNGLDKEIL